MGKVRTRILGLEDIEEQQKLEQKKRSAEKKSEKGEEPEVKAESKESKDADEAEEPKKKMTSQGKKKKEEGRNPKKGKTHPKSKNYKAAAKKADLEKDYKVEEAVSSLKKMAYAKFPESVELHLNVQKSGLKGEIELPHATGKTVRIKIVDDAVLEAIGAGKIDFDILISHPSYMPKLARFAKVLGPKGLMPNPKSGTVSPTPEEVVKKFEKGTMQWKTEPKAAVIHQMISKLTAEEKEISANVVAFLEAVGKVNIKSAFIKTTMSPALKLDISFLE